MYIHNESSEPQLSTAKRKTNALFIASFFFLFALKVNMLSFMHAIRIKCVPFETKENNKSFGLFVFASIHSISMEQIIICNKFLDKFEVQSFVFD